MRTKFDPKDILKLVKGDVQDFDLQAGSSGMTPAQAAARYLRSPGHFLALLRFFRNEKVEDVARASEISPETISAYEKGERPPSLKDLASLATHYRANLRVLLDVFGHVAQGATKPSMGIAAQFSGELSKDEKLSLQELVKHYSARIKKERVSKRRKDR